MYDSAPRPPPTPHSPVSKLSLFLKFPVCRQYILLTGDGWEGVGVEPNHMTARNFLEESLALYKSVNTL
jgi:hypothetical protein